MTPVYPSDQVLHVVKIIPPLKIFLNRRSGFDKWSLERRKAGNTILGDLGETCLIHLLTFDAAFSTKTAEPGNWGVQTFAPRYLAAHVKFCKTFRVRT